MNIELVDTELAESLKLFPDLDIWTDLVKNKGDGCPDARQDDRQSTANRGC